MTLTLSEHIYGEIEENDREDFISKWEKFENFTLPWSDWDDPLDRPRAMRRKNHIKNFWVPYAKTITPNFKTSNLAKELSNAWGNSELMRSDVSSPIRKGEKLFLICGNTFLHIIVLIKILNDCLVL